jgi:hypothetical protein
MLKGLHTGRMLMTPESEAWLEGLRQSAAADRLTPRDGERPAAEVAAERALLAARLGVWFDTELPGLLSERAAEAATLAPLVNRQIDPEPAVVLTTTVAGLAAAAELLDRDDPLMRQMRERFACVTEIEYRRFCMRQPDDDYRLHIAHWSWMKTRVPSQWWPRFARWPINAGEDYWLHRTGTAGAGRERRSSHLWKWNGTTAALLKPFLDEGIRGG